MKQKLMALLMAAAMLLSLTACGGTSAGYDDGKTVIGICQLAPHAALDAASQGFMDALTEKLGEGNVEFSLQNAAGDPATCSTICSTFANEGVDLIMANATAALAAAHAATADIPILGTSITDYATALDLDSWNGTVGGNISGTSDLAPLDQQAAMLQQLFPEAKKVAMLYCSGESNSLYQVNVVSGVLSKAGLEVENFTFTDSTDIAVVTQNACDWADVIYIPTDNVAANCTEAINNVASVAMVPIICGDEGTCVGCGVATLCIDYYDLGWATGLMAYEILVNGADISTMAVQTAPEVTAKYNPTLCALYGIEVPADFVAIG